MYFKIHVHHDTFVSYYKLLKEIQRWRISTKERWKHTGKKWNSSLISTIFFSFMQNFWISFQTKYWVKQNIDAYKEIEYTKTS